MPSPNGFSHMLDAICPNPTHSDHHMHDVARQVLQIAKPPKALEPFCGRLELMLLQDATHMAEIAYQVHMLQRLWAEYVS